MIKSMTGYGKASCETENKRITIELKSLNSKQLDINAKLPSAYREKEPEIRNIISNKLERGKIDLYITYEITGAISDYSINKNTAISHYRELKELAKELGEEPKDYFSLLIKMPDIFNSSTDNVSDEEWERFINAIEEVVAKVDGFRIAEGDILRKDIEGRICLIEELLNTIEPFEKARLNIIKDRIKNNLTEIIDTNKVDKNRFEQELIYYLEKIDITEEKIRLKKHLDYFIDTLNEKTSSGKKLSFVTQELGREINTIGSKANDVDIQKIVVRMKDELEKVKEQLANIL